MSTQVLPTAARRLGLSVRSTLLIVTILASSSSFARKSTTKQPAQPLPAPEINRNASRFILPQEQSAYLTRMVDRLSMTKRASDPFGRSQDPDAKPSVVATPGPARQRITSLAKNVPLQQVVSLLKVNTIIPAERRFLIGGRSFEVGDTVPITYRTKNIKAEVVSVSQSQILLRDKASGESATIETRLLPPGMQPGTSISDTPGLYRSNVEAPINLDAP